MPEAGGDSPPLADVLLLAARVWAAFVAGQSLDRALNAQAAVEAPRLRAAVQDVSYVAVRHRALTADLIDALAQRPPTDEVAALLAVALPQLLGERHGVHTVVDQAVMAARARPATLNAAGFVNAILRSFLRQRDALLARLQASDEVRFNAPAWWIEAVRAAQPDHWQAVLRSGQQAPALVLRVNRRRADVDTYFQRLLAAGMPATRVGEAAIWLHDPVPVARVPGFSEGEVSVQDAGAQLAAQWLDVHDGMRVLDACAAPGGKTGHLAEIATLELSALEIDAERARRIDQNLVRTGAAATVWVADARAPQSWWDHRPFDRILLDAPCTASGIVGRHPDIPWLRRKADVAHLATLQADLLEALWPLVGVGGRLLYVVCSVFPQEGSEQIARFVERHPDAAVEPLPGGTPAVQLLPTTEAVGGWNPTLAWPTRHDGFYYARLEKLR